MSRSAQFAVFLLPASGTKNRLLNLLGHSVDPTATVAPNLVFRLELLRLGPGARLAGGNRISGMRRVELGRDAIVGQLNRISAAPGSPPSGAALVLADHATVVSRHELDCSGGISVGRYSVLSGWHSLVSSSRWTKSGECQYLPVVIGAHVLVHAACSIAPGTTVADRVVLDVGSTASGDLSRTGHRYFGAPAVAVEALDDSDAFLHRTGTTLPAGSH